LNRKGFEATTLIIVLAAIAITAGLSALDSDPTGLVTFDIQSDCNCDGGVSKMTLRYDGTDTDVTIKVYNRNNPDENYLITTFSNVNSGDELFVDGTGLVGGEFSNEITWYVVETQEDVGIHLSCSDPLYLGQQFGSFTLTYMQDTSGVECDPANCGNGIVESGEDCDDGNTIQGDGCYNCEFEPFQTDCRFQCDFGKEFTADGTLTKIDFHQYSSNKNAFRKDDPACQDLLEFLGLDGQTSFDGVITQPIRIQTSIVEWETTNEFKVRFDFANNKVQISSDNPSTLTDGLMDQSLAQALGLTTRKIPTSHEPGEITFDGRTCTGIFKSANLNDITGESTGTTPTVGSFSLELYYDSCDTTGLADGTDLFYNAGSFKIGSEGFIVEEGTLRAEIDGDLVRFEIKADGDNVGTIFEGLEPVSVRTAENLFKPHVDHDNVCTPCEAVPEVGNCADGIDQDCDGLIDCQDPDCSGDDFCSQCTTDQDCDDNNVCNGDETCVAGECQQGTELNCNDGIACTDDTCNPTTGCSNEPNNTNCDDQDPCTIDTCNALTGCTNIFQFSCPNCPEEDTETQCTDQVDNDCDTYVDCDDPDCSNDPNCQECVPEAEDENTQDCDNGIDDDCDGDVDCDDAGCANAPICNGCTPSTESCTNGQDDDCDGLVDCEDLDDCATHETCLTDCVPTETPEVSCTDGLDNDCDGLIDCADSDCASNPACTECTEEIPDEGQGCSDGLDNDCDGPKDCDDPDCYDDPSCDDCTPTENPEISCNDNIDNDCDGLIDCSDPDCAEDPFCLTSECDTDLDCDNNDICDGLEKCVEGECQPGLPLNCDDGDECTTDSCNPLTGCINIFEFSCPNCPEEGTETQCQDEKDNDCDTYVDCDDPDCYDDPFCQECQTNDDCDDGNVCNGIETCVDFTCTTGTPLNCDDGVACTDDTCNPITGCDNTPDDGNCDDGDPCTNDVCNPLTGCTNIPFFECPQCPEEGTETKCTDQVDNDCDTYVDCDDPDCYDDPSCQECQTDADCDDDNPCTTDTCVQNECSNVISSINDPDGDGIPSGPSPECCIGGGE
jgi:hypothetical protein